MARRFSSRALLLLVPFTAACATPAYLTPWMEVRTEHFEIASSMQREETLALADDLETFRSVVQTLTNAKRFDPVVSTRIYAFRDEASYRRYSPKDSVGFLRSSMRGFTVALYPAPRIGTRAVVQHEYAHFLLRNQTALNYPLWYNEGFAELFGATTIVGDQVRVGLAPAYRIDTLRYGDWISIEKVVEARSLAEFPGPAATFYAESWALVHYLHYGREDRESTAAQMTRYLSIIDAGFEPDEAWRGAFDGDLDEVDDELKAYLAEGPPAFGLDARKFRPSSAHRTRSLPRDEIAAELGWLSVVAGARGRAERSFEAAIANNPRNGRAHAGLGETRRGQNRWQEAERHYARALEVAPQDPYNHLDYAKYLHGRALLSEDETSRTRLIRRARRHYVRSQKLDGNIPETYAMYGSTFLTEGDDPSRGLETLEHAHALLRSNLDIQILLAELYIATGRGDEARGLLERVMAWSHAERQLTAARHLISTLAEAETRADKPAAGPNWLPPPIATRDRPSPSPRVRSIRDAGRHDSTGG